MEHTVKVQAKRAGIALAVAAVLAGLGTGTAQAQQFTRADISLTNTGALQCSFRETGLGRIASITYDCGAQAVGVVSGCFAKNKFVGPTAVSISKNVTTEESEPLLAKNNGAIGATITVEVPEQEHALVCTPPAEPQVVAARWCNASLVDVTNGITGASVGELFAQVARTGTQVIIVPTCAELLAAP